MISRRSFIAQAAVAASAFAADEVSGIVDTHTHFYDPTRPQGVPWPPMNDALLYRTVLPPEYRKLAAPQGIIGTIVVEASPWLEDNQWVLDLAAKEPFILGVVGNLDPLAADFAAHLKRFAANPKFRGIRVAGKQLVENGSTQPYINSLRLLAKSGLSLDVNGDSDYLGKLPALCRAIPEIRIMVNHVGSAGNPTKLSAQWRDGIRSAAESPNVFCKVSGIPEQSGAPRGAAPIATDFYRPILDFVWEAFGEKRVVFGSNWPVSNIGTSFENVTKIIRPYFAAKGPAAEKQYFLENARSFYRWPA
jgi:predicted TIM-barrel fold metal-dependent hydrolase